jgi:hypothetical protein
LKKRNDATTIASFMNAEQEKKQVKNKKGDK